MTALVTIAAFVLLPAGLAAVWCMGREMVNHRTGSRLPAWFWQTMGVM